MKIQKNIRVDENVAKWMDSHPLSNNSLVTYALYLLMQMEANAQKPLQGYMQVSAVLSPEQVNSPFPF
jgi:hypothetical protein